jgi:hypothetical protein
VGQIKLSVLNLAVEHRMELEVARNEQQIGRIRSNKNVLAPKQKFL